MTPAVAEMHPLDAHYEAAEIAAALEHVHGQAEALLRRARAVKTRAFSGIDECAARLAVRR